MTQFNFGTIVATTKSGAGLASDLNAWRDAVHSKHKGPARPTYAIPGVAWINDSVSPWSEQIFDGTGDALRGFIDPATHRYSSAGNYARTISSGGVTAHLADWGTSFNMAGAAAQTVAIDTIGTLMPGWWMRVVARNVAVTIDPFGGETIDGAATKVMAAGSSTTVFYDGVALYTDQNSGGLTDFPIGGIMYAPANAPPNGFLRMNGALLNRTTYAGLWGYAQASGNIAASDGAWNYGMFSPGDGSTTFRIPDGRGFFIRSWDNGIGIDPSRVLGTYQPGDMASHAHTASSTANAAHTHTFSDTSDSKGSHSHTTLMYPAQLVVVTDGLAVGGYRDLGAGQNSAQPSNAAGAHTHVVSGTTSSVAGHTHPITVNPAGGAETRPINIALLACIKY